MSLAGRGRRVSGSKLHTLFIYLFIFVVVTSNIGNVCRNETTKFNITKLNKLFLFKLCSGQMRYKSNVWWGTPSECLRTKRWPHTRKIPQTHWNMVVDHWCVGSAVWLVVQELLGGLVVPWILPRTRKLLPLVSPARRLKCSHRQRFQQDYTPCEHPHKHRNCHRDKKGCFFYNGFLGLWI